MKTETELQIRKLLQLMEMENNLARREVECGDGWLYDHAQTIREYVAMVDALLTDPEVPHE